MRNNQYTKRKSDFDKIKDQLTIGEKYTFWGYDEEGNPFSERIELRMVEIENHGTESSLFLWFRPFRKQKRAGLHRLTHETFLIFKGWYTPPLGDLETALNRKPFIHYERGLV